MLSGSSGKEKGSIKTAQTANLMFVFLNSIRQSDDMSIAFQRDTQTREQELSNDKRTKGSYQPKVY